MPAMLTGSLAEENGGAYARSRFLQVLHGEACEYGRGENVDALVHALLASYLGPQNATGALFHDKLDGELLRTRVVP